MNAQENWLSKFNESELIKVTPEILKTLKKGTIIGIDGYGKKKINVVYIFHSNVNNDEFLYYLSMPGDVGILDNTWISVQNIFITKKPMIYKGRFKKEQTLHQRIESFFNTNQPTSQKHSERDLGSGVVILFRSTAGVAYPVEGGWRFMPSTGGDAITISDEQYSACTVLARLDKSTD